MIKAKTKRKSKSLDMDLVGHLPDWSTIDSYDDEKFHVMLTDSLRHYGYFFGLKDMRKHMNKWVEANVPDADTVKLYKRTPDWRTPMTAMSLARANLNGMPMKPEHFEYVMDKVTSSIASGPSAFTVEDDEPAAKVKKPKQPTIQDRINAKINDHILHFEIEYEDGIIERKEKHPKPEVKSYLAQEEVPPSMVTKIVEHFQAQWDEISGSQGKDADEQLKEAYSHLTKTDVKRFVDFYKALIADLNMYKEQKKVARAPRKKKPVSKTKQVAKLTYLKSFEALKLVSVNPQDLIDSKTVWVYNTKTRKLGVYHADDYGSMGIKGTTLTGFDKAKSVAKTLRKPKEQLAEFNKAGKVKLRTFMEDIKAVAINLTGRINKDTVLLKVF